MPGAVDGGSENNDSSPPPLFVVMQEGRGTSFESERETGSGASLEVSAKS